MHNLLHRIGRLLQQCFVRLVQVFVVAMVSGRAMDLVGQNLESVRHGHPVPTHRLTLKRLGQVFVFGTVRAVELIVRGQP
jgi:hypothetical protein